MAVCDNSSCRFHLPMPACLPDDADAVGVSIPSPPMTRHGHSYANQSVQTIVVRRHLYRRLAGDFYLCDECHEARQKGGAA